MKLAVKLVGTTQCRRYQRMRERLLQQAAGLGLGLQLEEENQIQQLSQYDPLNLPMMFIRGKLVAAKNPPKEQVLRRQLLEAWQQTPELPGE